MHNLEAQPREVEFNPGVRGTNDSCYELLSDDQSRADASGKYSILMEPYGYRWYRVGGLDYLPRRSDV